MKIEIKRWDNGKIIVCGEYESIKECLEKNSSADLSSADLRSANLRSADLRYADLRSANLDKRYIQVSCIGSRKDMTTYCFDDDEITCGCWCGKLKDFEARVKETHKENAQFLSEYLGFIEYVKALRAASNPRHDR